MIQYTTQIEYCLSVYVCHFSMTIKWKSINDVHKFENKSAVTCVRMHQFLVTRKNSDSETVFTKYQSSAIAKYFYKFVYFQQTNFSKIYFMKFKQILNVTLFPAMKLTNSAANFILYLSLLLCCFCYHFCRMHASRQIDTQVMSIADLNVSSYIHKWTRIPCKMYNNLCIFGLNNVNITLFPHI